MDQSAPAKICKCPHHKMVPLLIILIGLVFLLKGLGWLSASMTDILWPIGLIMLGGQKMFEGLCKCDVKDQRP